jgi:hypothetical protein
LIDRNISKKVKDDLDEVKIQISEIDELFK